MSWIGHLVNAVSLGVVYGLVAVSVGLVFGVLRQVNLAQGEVIALGAYSLWMTRDLPVVVRILVCIGVCVAMSLVIQVIIFRPLRGASALTTLIVTFGLSYALEGVWTIVFGTNGQPVSMLSSLNHALVVLENLSSSSLILTVAAQKQASVLSLVLPHQGHFIDWLMVTSGFRWPW